MSDPDHEPARAGLVAAADGAGPAGGDDAAAEAVAPERLVASREGGRP